MDRFKRIPPLDMSDFFVREEELDIFHPDDWNMPLPWITTFIFTHCTGHFWGYGDNHGGAENFDNNGEKTRIVYDYEAKTCFKEAVSIRLNIT